MKGYNGWYLPLLLEVCFPWLAKYLKFLLVIPDFFVSSCFWGFVGFKKYVSEWDMTSF